MRRVLFLFFFLLLSLIFIPSYERDEVLYHLAIPKYWFLTNFTTPDFSHFFYYPALPYLFNFIGLFLKLPSLAHLFHLFFLALTVYLLKKEIKENIANFSILLFITIQPVLRFAYAAYADFYLLFFATASFLLIKRWYEKGNRLNFLLSAVSCGLGLTTKYNMLVMALVFYFMVIWLAYEKFKSAKKMIYYSSLYASISLILFVPQMLKNYLLTGNPIYPLMGSIFRSTNDFAFENVSHFAFRKYFYNENIFQILLTPLMVFFYGRENNIQFFDGVLNPFFVIFPIFAVFTIKKREYTIYFLAGWLYNLIVLFLEPVSARFLLPSVPLFTIVAAHGLSKLKLSEKKLFLIFLPFIIFNLYFGGKHLTDKDKWQYLLGRMSKDEFLERKCPDYKSIRFINENTPENSKILHLFSGQRTFYLQRDFIYDSFNDGRLFKRIFGGIKDETELCQKFKQMSVTHLFIRKDLFKTFVNENFSSKEIEIINNFFRKKGEIIFADNFFLVFKINYD